MHQVVQHTQSLNNILHTKMRCFWNLYNFEISNFNRFISWPSMVSNQPLSTTSVHDNSHKIPEKKQTLMALSQKVCKHYQWTDYVNTEQVPGTTAEISVLASIYQLLVSQTHPIHRGNRHTAKTKADHSTPHWSFSFSPFHCQTSLISTIIASA